MNNGYTTARNAQIILYLLKARGIRKVIASPGTQNMSLVVSMQRDPFFEMYSAADERSAAYMACGMAATSGEPVVLSCTGATASRNYISGLTEAYYRHLPVIAITSGGRSSMIGHDIAQVIDRTSIPKDIALISVNAQVIHDGDDEWNCTVQVNKALLETCHHGGGPVHINLEKENDTDFSCYEMPPCRVIERFSYSDKLPNITKGKKVAILIGSHVPFTEENQAIIEHFCECHDAVVFCDHTSNYHGKYKVLPALIGSQGKYHSPALDFDIIIQLGGVTGNYYQLKIGANAKEVWRVNEDGFIKDTFKRLQYVFEMDEVSFFSNYVLNKDKLDNLEINRYKECLNEYELILSKIPQLPFSSIWIAKKMAAKMPHGCIVHFGILNSLRSWNFFVLDDSIDCFSNVGGFGIDGGISSFIGSALASPKNLHFGVFGDLAFFYDMNVLGNRHIPKNVRILLVNNAKGTEFRLYSHPASRLGDMADEFIAAARHYGNKSSWLVKHYSEDLGFKYLSASNKQDFDLVLDSFLQPNDFNVPVVFEVFTDSKDENDALLCVNSILKSRENQRKEKIMKIIGEENAHAIKRFIDKVKP